MKRNKILVITFVLVATALICSGGFNECMQKGVGICWECIGLG